MINLKKENKINLKKNLKASNNYIKQLNKKINFKKVVRQIILNDI